MVNINNHLIEGFRKKNSKNYPLFVDNRLTPFSFIHLGKATNIHTKTFSQNWPLGRLFLVVAMSMYISICLLPMQYFQDLSLALRSHEQFQASLVNPPSLPLPRPPQKIYIYIFQIKVPAAAAADQKKIGATFRICQKILCLPYAGFSPHFCWPTSPLALIHFYPNYKYFTFFSLIFF